MWRRPEASTHREAALRHGRVVYVGLAGTPSTVDTRQITLKDVTAVGILSASPALDDTIEAFASANINPSPLIGATVPLERAGDVLTP